LRVDRIIVFKEEHPGTDLIKKASTEVERIGSQIIKVQFTEFIGKRKKKVTHIEVTRDELENMIGESEKPVRVQFTLLLQKPRMPQIQGVQGRASTELSRSQAVVFYCEPLATKEMGHPRLSLRVKNMTILLFVFNVTKSLFGKQVQTYSNALLLFFFSMPCHVFYATAGFTLF